MYRSNYIDYAHSLFVHFVQSFGELYGEEYISHNVHGLIHLCDDVRKFGSLDSFSAFKFENYMQHLKKCLRKPDQPLQQLVRRFLESQITVAHLETVNM